MKVVSYQYLPVRFPLAGTILLWLFVDRLGPSEIWWGVFWTLIIVWWVWCIRHFYKEELYEPEWKK